MAAVQAVRGGWEAFKGQSRPEYRWKLSVLSLRAWSRWRTGLVVITVVALVARLGIIVATPHFVPWGDPADYARHAASIALGHGMAVTSIATPGTSSAFRPPGYPFLLGGVWSLFGINLTIGRLLSALLGTVTVILVAFLGRALMGDRIGLIAAAGVAVFPALVALNATYLSEALFIPIELGLAICLLRLRRSGSLRLAVLAGFLCGLAALTRSVGILWLVPVALVAWRSAPQRRQAARAVGAVIVTVVIVLVPWTVRNYEAFHAFVPVTTQDGFTLAGQYNDEAGHVDALHAVWRDPLDVAALKPLLKQVADAHHGVANEAQLDAAYRHAAIHYAEAHPMHILAASWLNTLRLFAADTGHKASADIAYTEMDLPRSLWSITTLSAQLLLVLAAIALVLRLTKRLPTLRGPWYVWALPAIAIATTIPVSGTPRYRTTIDPFLLLITAPLIAWFVRKVADALRMALPPRTSGQEALAP